MLHGYVAKVVLDWLFLGMLTICKPRSEGAFGCTSTCLSYIVLTWIHFVTVYILHPNSVPR